jgi:hypothetical protein
MGIRTPGLVIANDALYQLSYTPKNWSAGRHSSHCAPFFKPCAGSAIIARRMTIAFSTPIG